MISYLVIGTTVLVTHHHTVRGSDLRYQAEGWFFFKYYDQVAYSRFKTIGFVREQLGIRVDKLLL